jgi:hypothetical protein
MPKSPYNSTRLSDTPVKAKTPILLHFAIIYKNVFETTNINHRFIASLLYFFSFFLLKIMAIEANLGSDGVTEH